MHVPLDPSVQESKYFRKTVIGEARLVCTTAVFLVTVALTGKLQLRESWPT